MPVSSQGASETFVALPDSSLPVSDSSLLPCAPQAYVAGDPINGTATWANKTYASLGLASSGTWSWTAENGQTVVFRINAVPEPAVCAGGVVAAVTVGAWLRRRRSAKA